MFSVIVPAWNEASLIEATLQDANNAINACDEVGELIVVDNNSTDATADIARQCGATVVFEPVNQISRARNAGVAASKGIWLVFVDADTTLSAELLKEAITRLSSGHVVGGGCTVAGDRSATGFEAWALRTWNRIAIRFKLAAGCFVFCTRDGFDAVGGFSERLYASEEVWFSRALRRYGRRRNQRFEIISEPPIKTSMRKTEWYSPWQLALQGLLALIPFSVASKTLCAFWYRRPESDEN